MTSSVALRCCGGFDGLFALIRILMWMRDALLASSTQFPASLTSIDRLRLGVSKVSTEKRKEWAVRGCREDGGLVLARSGMTVSEVSAAFH